MPKRIQPPLADRKFMIRKSGEALSAASDMIDDVPDTRPHRPGLVIPEPSSWHIMSPLPATTGVPLVRPVRPATSLVTVPITDQESTISGSLARSTPSTSISASDHWPVAASQRNEPEASAGSVAT